MPFPELQIERISNTRTLTDRVFLALTQSIGAHDFPAGSRLPSEMTMAARFGVSRTVIREALSRLKSEGMVESRQGSGVFVRVRNSDTPFRINSDSMDSIHSILQVIELRHALEGEIAALAAKRRNLDQMKSIKQALEAIETEVQAGGDGVDADMNFHHCIAEATGNPHFLAFIEFLTKSLLTTTRTLRHYEASRASLTQQVKDEHQAIVDALTRQDAEAARLAARKHMEGASKRLGSADKKMLAARTSVPST